MIDRIDAARERYFRQMFANWEPGEVAELTRLMRKWADAWRKPPVCKKPAARFPCRPFAAMIGLKMNCFLLLAKRPRPRCP